MARLDTTSLLSTAAMPVDALVSVSVTDTASGVALLPPRTPPVAFSAVPPTTRVYAFLGRSWSIVVAPGDGLLAAHIGAAPTIILAVGLPLAGCLGALVLVLLSSRARARRAWAAKLVADAADGTHHRIMCYVRGGACFLLRACVCASMTLCV